MVRLTYSKEAPYDRVIDWCRMNLGEGGYGYFDPEPYIPEPDTWAFVYDVSKLHFYFRHEEDAVLFKMAWL